MNRHHFPVLFLSAAAGFYALAIVLVGYAPFDASDWRPALAMWGSVGLATVFAGASVLSYQNIVLGGQRR